MKISILTGPYFHDCKEVTREINGQKVHGQDRIIYGGAERVLRDLCALLQEDMHDIVVYQPFPGISAPFSKQYKGITFVMIPSNSGWEYNTNTDLNWQFNEYSALSDLRIYFCTYLSWPNAVPPCITISHGIYWDNIQGDTIVKNLSEEQRREFFKRQLYGFTQADMCIAVDSNVRKVIQAIEPGSERKIHIINNYVDCSKFFPAEKKTWNGINVLFPRRLTVLRGSTEVTKAFMNMPQYNFTLAGQAHDDAAAQAFFKSHENRKNVKFIHKEMDDMPEVFRQADISLVPTISTEGLSLSLLESMATGLPTITTPVGGLGDACLPGYNCLIYDPNHEDICDYIQALAEDEETRIKFGKRNREIALESFDISLWKARWRQLLAQFGAKPECSKMSFNNIPAADLKDEDIDNIISNEAGRILDDRRKELQEIRQKAIDAIPKKPKLVAMMLTHNEAGRYLERVIENTLLFCDEIVILDNHSTDETKNIILTMLNSKKYLGRISLGYARNSWENESELRQELLTSTLYSKPDWLIAIDADELYEADKMKEQLPYLMSQDNADWIGFRFFDMWDEEHYRDDDIWPAGNGHAPRMFRVKSNTEYQWPDLRRHCGSVPINVMKAPGMNSDIRVKHLGWMTSDDRNKKYLDRVVDDPNCEFFPIEVYNAILDDHPTLVKWDDNNPWPTSKLTIAYPPGMEWNVMQQRPHHLLKMAAGDRNRIIFGDDSASGAYEALPYLTVVDGKTFDDLKEVDILYVTSPEQMKHCGNIRCKKVIYDCCDWVNGADLDLIYGADLVLCASKMLYDKIQNDVYGDNNGFSLNTKGGCHGHGRTRDSLIYLPNACDFDHFSKAVDPDPIVPEPVVGYMGCIHPTMIDEKIVNAIAEKYKIMMIGQNKGMEFNNKNIYPAGHIAYRNLPGLLSQCKVAVIPFRTDSDYLRYSAPIKVYEFLAMSRPVVASPIPELKPLADAGLIRIVPNDDLDGWIKAIDEAVTEYPNKVGREFARTQTWAQRWQQIKMAIG
jgi:glycosyltransferase involved in cell wall biosynthesis